MSEREVQRMMSTALQRKAAVVACGFLLLGAAVGSSSHASKTGQPPKAPRPIELYSVAFSSAANGWVGGKGVVYATVDGGAHWRLQYSGHVNIYSLDFIDGRNGWAAGIDPIWGTGVLLGTSDGGAHWIKLGEPPHPLRSLSFADSSNGVGIAGGSLVRLSLAEWGTQPFIGGRIVLTHDGGRSWSVVDTPQSADSACFSDANSAWSGNQASVQRSIDGGATFHYVLGARVDPYRNWSARLACADSQTVWALFESTDAISGSEGRPFVLYRSADGGNHWTAVLENPGASSAYRGIQTSAAPTVDAGPFAVAGPSRAIVLGFSAENVARSTGLSALVTNSGGATWLSAAAIPAFGPTSPIGISAVGSSRAWIVGTAAGRGRIFSTADGGRVWTEQYIR